MMACVLPQKDELVPPWISNPYSFYTRSLFCQYASFMVLGWKHGLKVEHKIHSVIKYSTFVWETHLTQSDECELISLRSEM